MSKTRFQRLIEKLKAVGGLPSSTDAIVDVVMELHNQIKIQKEFIGQLETRVDNLEYRFNEPNWRNTDR